MTDRHAPVTVHYAAALEHLRRAAEHRHEQEALHAAYIARALQTPAGEPTTTETEAAP